MLPSSRDAEGSDTRASGASRAHARLIRARAAVLVLAALMAYSAADGVTAYLEYMLFRASSGALPSWPARAALCVLGDAVGLGALLFAIRHAASVPERFQRPSGLAWVGLCALGCAGVIGIAVGIWFPKEIAEEIGRTRPVSELAAWGEDTLRVAFIGIATRTVVTLAAFAAAGIQMWLAVEAWRKDEVRPPDERESGSS